MTIDQTYKVFPGNATLEVTVCYLGAISAHFRPRVSLNPSSGQAASIVIPNNTSTVVRWIIGAALMLQRHLVVILAAICLIALLSPSTSRSDEVERLLVYGASGRIGQHIVDEALLRGYAVSGVTRARPRLAENAHRVNVVVGDILDRSSTRQLIESHDAVIVSVGGAPQDSNPANYIVPLAAASLIEVLQELGDEGPRVIFVGNLFTLIYADGKTLLELDRVSEAHENFAMFYGHQVALELFRASEGVNWTIATPPNGLRLTGRTGNVRWGGDTLLRDPDGAPSQISPEDFAFAVLEELEAGNYIKRQFNVARSEAGQVDN